MGNSDTFAPVSNTGQALSLSKGFLWFDKLTMNGASGLFGLRWTHHERKDIPNTMQTETLTVEDKSTETRKKRVLSGIQPSGDLHLGNYLGAIKRWVERQYEKENYFCIVDLHAITLPHDPATLRHRTRAVAALYIASGLDPDHCPHFHPESPVPPTRRRAGY